jgi:hypothetical protein
LKDQEESIVPTLEQLRALEFMGSVLWSRNSFGVLYSEPGCRKTLLVRLFLEQLDERIARVHIDRCDFDSREFLRATLLQLGIAIETEDRTDLRRLLERYLEHRASLGRMAVLVVENAQRLRPQVLEELGQLAALKVGGVRILKILLTGDASLCCVVDSPRMRELLGEAGIRLALSLARPACASLRMSMQGIEEREIVLTASRLVIGRSESADLQIDSSFVSRYHALILREGSQHLLMDLGSTNGFLVNSHRVQKRLLQDGDLIQIGPVRLDYRSQPGLGAQEGDATLSMRGPVLPEQDQSVVSFGRAS